MTIRCIRVFKIRTIYINTNCAFNVLLENTVGIYNSKCDEAYL